MTPEELVADVARLERRIDRLVETLRIAQMALEQTHGLMLRVAANGPTVGAVIARELGLGRG